MAAIPPAVPSLAAFFKNSRLWSIATVHTKERVATSSLISFTMHAWTLFRLAFNFAFCETLDSERD
jgi:hypothetical protein